MGHLSLTTCADQTRNSTNATRLDGTNVGIAILDSGINVTHDSFLNRSNSVRVVYSEDHRRGSHGRSLWARHSCRLARGRQRPDFNAECTGGARRKSDQPACFELTRLRQTASVLRALDWVTSNRAAYNIRVVNMSLGMPAIDSYRDDPVCRAVRRLVDAGVVVFAAAGNNGKDDEGNKAYGHIHSPGNEPSAITVGASNTFGTDERDDDGVASFSSRGPTRSFTTDEQGTKHYDNIVKPDLVAPGNKLIEAEAESNYLVTQTPSLDAGVSSAYHRASCA